MTVAIVVKRNACMVTQMSSAYLILELVVLAHVFAILAFCNFAPTLVHCAVLLKLWLAEHACNTTAAA